MVYKWCVVPQCTNTSIKTPQKLFVSVPTNCKRRKKWLLLARRDPKSILSHSNVFMCEDHFEMEKDTINYMQYKMGFSKNILLSEDAVPTKFHCHNRKSLLSNAGPSRGAFLKRQRIDLVNELRQSQNTTEAHMGSVQKDDNIIQEIIEELPKPQDRQTITDHTITAEKSVQLPNDMENFMQYHVMGSVSQIRMKPGCIPTRFECQSDEKKGTGCKITKRSRRKMLIGECEKEVEESTLEGLNPKGQKSRKKRQLTTQAKGSHTPASCSTASTSTNQVVEEQITMALPKIENSSGEVVNFDHLRLRVGNAKTAASYFITRLGFAPFAERRPTDERPVTSYVVKQNNIILVFESAVSDCKVSDEVHAYGDFVKDVAFAVHDLDELVSAARANGAELVEPVTEESDEYGVLRYAVLRTYGDNTHTLIDRSNYTGLLLPGFQASEEDLLTQILPDTNLTHIDHVEANMADGTLADSVDWYEKNLNMKRFWCVDYEKELTPYSCIKSDSVINRNESVLLSFNEAAPGLRPTSKASEFVKALGSAGVEHIALYTDDIVGTMRSLKSRGAAILSWPATYYDLIRLKLRDGGTEVKESIQELQDNNILVDFDEHGYMLQAFTAHLQPRPTLFVELIQRRNHRGFGAMNYKWVFQAIEVLQIKQEKE